jgi:SlyX protein
MEQRLIDLESRLAFQEHTLQQLNDVVVELRAQLDLVTRRLQIAEERLRAIEPAMVAAPQDETPPPHY